MAESFPISGAIDPKAFPFLLMDLHRQGATGSLKVEGPSYQKALYYRSGRILFGSSNDPRDQLGAILIEGGKINPEQLEDVNAKVGPGNPLAKVLSESGYLSQRELGEAARTKVERILSDVIAYDAGSFEFEDGVLPKGAVDLKLSTEKLVLAAVRRVADRNFVLRHLGGLEVVLAPTGALAGVEEIGAEIGGLGDHLNGERSLKEAASLTRLEEFEAAKVACVLLFLGLVKPSGTTGGASDELDLAATARMAFSTEASEPVGAMVAAPMGAPTATAESEAEPFFVTDAAPPGFSSPGDSGSFVVEGGASYEAAAEAPPDSSEASGFAMSEPEAFVPPPFEPSPPPGPEPVLEAAPEPEPPLPVAPPPRPPAPALEPPRSPSASSRSSIPLIPPPPRPLRETRHEPPPSLASLSAPAPPAASRPSKEDLAALDALLNNRAIEGPLEPLERPTARAPRWEPRFGQQGARGRPERRPNTGLIAAVVLLVLGAGAAGGWYYMRRPDATAQASRAPRPTLATPTTTLSAVVASPPATPAPPLVPSPVAATPQQPPAERSSRPVDPAPTAGGLAAARSLLVKGDVSGAATAFASHVQGVPRGFSVQILVACAPETVTKALANVTDQELYVLPVNYKGRDCYRLCWGLYDTEARAGSALRSVPDYFSRGGATPKVVPTSTLLP